MRNKTRISSLSALAVSIAALIAASPAFAGQSKTLAAAEPAEIIRDDPSTIGLAFTYFWYDMLEKPTDCPEGYAMALRDIAIMDLPEEKQQYLLKAENRSTYYKMGYALSAKRQKEQGGKSVCNVPLEYDDPPLRTVQSSNAYGRDLDGLTSDGADDDSCGGVDFTAPDGRTGIDNQLYRVMGCIDSFRRDPEFAGGAMEDYHVGAYRDGEITTLMEIRGVDDRMNDPEVEVGVYSSQEPTPYDSEKKGIGYASLTVTDNLLWQNETTGRIENGVLITDPFDLRLKFGWTGRPAEYVIRGARIHMTLDEAGNATGDLAGYFDLKHAYWHNFHDEQGALQVANGYTCPSVWRALEAFADGERDPQTGKCKAISTAMKIEAVPAFVIHPPKEQLTKYFLDTREYYGVEMAEIAVEGAEPRLPEGAGGPPTSAQEKAADAELAKAA